MTKKIYKKAGFIVIILSLLGLIGCANLNQRQAKQIEKKLGEMYEGETFEVLAIGERWGTPSNDTVTAYVKAIKRDVVFLIKMDLKGEIVVNTYPERALSSQLEELLNKNLKNEGITADSLTIGFSTKGVLRSQDPNTPLSEYISNYTPDYFSGHLVIKESTNNTGDAFIRAFRETYKEIQKTRLQANVWVLPEENYDGVIEKFSRLPEVDNDWFRDKNPLSFFQFYIEKNGETNMDEDELNMHLQGGE